MHACILRSLTVDENIPVVEPLPLSLPDVIHVMEASGLPCFSASLFFAALFVVSIHDVEH